MSTRTLSGAGRSADSARADIVRDLDKIEEVEGREEEDRDGRVRDRDEKEREWFKAAVGIVGDTDPELVVLRPT